MKRTIWCIAWILSGLIMGGCGAGHGGQPDLGTVQEPQIPSDKNKDSENKDSGSETMKNEESDNETSDSETLDISQQETTGENAPTIGITSERKEWYTDDGETVLLTVDADKVEAAGDGFESLNTALSAQWGGLTGNYDDLLQTAGEHYDSMEEKNYFMSYHNSESVVVYRVDNHVASFCSIYDAYAGGAHNFYAFDGATFDVKSGKRLQLEDILSDTDGFYDKAVRYIIEELEENYGDGLFPEYQEVVEADTFGETPMCWYLDNTGIVIEYGLYSVAPYVTGAPSVTLPYDVFAEYLKEEYTSPCSSIIARVRENEDVSRLLGEDGKVMLVSANDEEYGASELTVVSGNSSESAGTFSQFVMGYVIKRTDGRSFLIFYCDYASDDYVTYVYEVTGGKVRACDKLDDVSFVGSYLGASEKFYLGTDELGLFMHLNVFGSYTGSMKYHLTEEGKLVQAEEIFVIDTPFELTVVKELPVTLEGVETTIPAGSVLKITGTDNAGTAYFRLDTGETGTISYVRDREQWQLLIDGVSENEYFEMLPYAG
ncbi:MAG: RsiV family protein [Lachnospiraceae bacterium]|nr:RsiV family protein [Lachnospiraceae bacterium]